MFGKKEPKYIVVDCALNCIKEKCPKWVILNQNIIDAEGNKKVVPEGKCAIAWIPTLMIELFKKV
jgi:hypothetical protein